MKNFADMWKWDLRRGNSDNPANGACVMDAVSWFHYGTLGDHPACACPVITEFAIRVNDALPDDERQKLKPFIFRMIGNRDPESEQARAEYLAWRAIRVFAPFALDATGLSDHAERLRSFGGSLKEAASAATYAADAAGAAGAAYAAGAAGAAYAADAAAYAAYAADAADAAADAAAYAAAAAAAYAAAAAAAYAAADAASVAKIKQAMIDTLDGVLKIGKQADEITQLQALEAVQAFEDARA